MATSQSKTASKKTASKKTASGGKAKANGFRTVKLATDLHGHDSLGERFVVPAGERYKVSEKLLEKCPNLDADSPIKVSRGLAHMASIEPAQTQKAGEIEADVAGENPSAE